VAISDDVTASHEQALQEARSVSAILTHLILERAVVDHGRLTGAQPASPDHEADLEGRRPGSRATDPSARGGGA
jgi:hypothetical protein